MNRYYRYRLYPNEKQAVALTEMFGAFCDLYNAALQERVDAHNRKGLRITWVDQCNQLSAVREADNRFLPYSVAAQQQVFRRLDRAFAGFFRRHKAGDKRPGFPRYRAKSRYKSADFRVGNGLTIRKSGRIGIQAVPGEIRIKWHRPLPATAKLGTAIVLEKNDQWWVFFSVELPDPTPEPRPYAEIGVDLGLMSLVALSNGETIPVQQWRRREEKKLRRLSRAATRKRRSSKRQKRAWKQVARAHARIAAKRKDFSHKLSRSLTDRFTHIAFEKLNMASLTRGHHSKSVYDVAWNQLVLHVTYKAACAGGTVALVNPRGTSQTCPECGAVAAKSLRQRMHCCPCGCTLDRDIAAAQVILSRANFGPGHGHQALSQRTTA